jgi:hypothetical protein
MRECVNATIEDVTMMNNGENRLTFASLPETMPYPRNEAGAAEVAVVGPVVLFSGTVTTYHTVGVFVRVRFALVVATLRNISLLALRHGLPDLHHRDRLCCSMRICNGCQQGPEANTSQVKRRAYLNHLYDFA